MYSSPFTSCTHLLPCRSFLVGQQRAFLVRYTLFPQISSQNPSVEYDHRDGQSESRDDVNGHWDLIRSVRRSQDSAVVSTNQGRTVCQLFSLCLAPVACVTNVYGSSSVPFSTVASEMFPGTRVLSIDLRTSPCWEDCNHEYNSTGNRLGYWETGSRCGRWMGYYVLYGMLVYHQDMQPEYEDIM